MRRVSGYGATPWMFFEPMMMLAFIAISMAGTFLACATLVFGH